MLKSVTFAFLLGVIAAPAQDISAFHSDYAMVPGPFGDPLPDRAFNTPLDAPEMGIG